MKSLAKVLKGITLCQLAKIKLPDWFRAAAKIVRPGRMKILRRRSARIGQAGERAACHYLLNAGYELLARNYRAPHGVGELDLVMRDGAGVLCFVEVKTRREKPGQALRPAEAVHDEKQRRLRKAGTAYLRALAAPAMTARFDVVEVWAAPNGALRRLRHWPDAFPASQPTTTRRYS